MLLVMLAATHLEDAHLVVLTVRQNCGDDAGTRDPGGSDFQVCAASDGQHLIDRDVLAHVRSYLFYLDLFAGCNLVLLATGFYDRVHV